VTVCYQPCPEDGWRDIRTGFYIVWVIVGDKFPIVPVKYLGMSVSCPIPYTGQHDTYSLLYPSILTFRDFSLSVKVPVRLHKQLGYIRSSSLEGIPDRVSRSHITCSSSTLFTRSQAQESR
jgi:hypothetical protein